MTTVFDSPDDLAAAVGTHLGHSEWVDVDQARIDQFLMGLVLGPAALGLYFFAQKLTEMLRNLTVGMFSPVSNVLFASLQSDVEKRRIAFTKALFAVGAFNLPVFGGLIALAPTAVPTVFGSQWTEAIPAVQALAVMGILGGIGTLQAAVIRNLGESGWWFWFQTGLRLTEFALILAVFPLGLNAVIAASLIRMVLIWPLSVRKTRVMLDLERGAYLTTLAAPAAATTTAIKPALWAVKDDDTTVYLFGTVHVLKPGLSWFDGAVKDAFDKSDELKLELVLPEDQNEVAKETMALALDQSGTALSARLDPAALAAYQAAMTSLGLPPASFDGFKPWFAGITLSVLPLTKMGYNPEEGAEKQLSNAAKAAAKPISGFETLSEQLGFFDALPMSSQIAFLNVMVKDLDKLGPQLDTMVGQWGAGDPAALAETMNEGLAETPDVAKTLLWDRNARWAEQIEARMAQPGTVFVAVGAGHLAGAKSVQDYLKERGLKVTRIQ